MGVRQHLGEKARMLGGELGWRNGIRVRRCRSHQRCQTRVAQGAQRDFAVSAADRTLPAALVGLGVQVEVRQLVNVQLLLREALGEQ
jgi:hypothetical protein